MNVLKSRGTLCNEYTYFLGHIVKNETMRERQTENPTLCQSQADKIHPERRVVELE